MIIILKQNANQDKVERLKETLIHRGFKLHLSQGTEASLIGLIGDTSSIQEDWLRAIDVVEDVKRIREPYKKASRSMHPEDSRVQITEVAQDVKISGAHFLRGGAFKPRSSPYAFEGLHEQGLEFLLNAKQATGLPVVTEIMSAEHLPLFEDVDVIQVGARNMQNFELLKELGKLQKPILLKRGLANTLDELLMSAEYILAGGNENVILCERGIRTFETSTRNTLDISAIPVLKQKTHLPVIVDPSHASGIRSLVEPLSLAAIAAGADGLIIEVHNNPEKALCDGAQSLTPEMFDALMKKIDRSVEFFRELS